MNRANLQGEVKGYPAGGSNAHRFGSLSGYDHCDYDDCVCPQCDRHFQKRNRPTMEWIGSQFPLRHRSCLYAERPEDISARTTPGALTEWARDVFKPDKRSREATAWPKSERSKRLRLNASERRRKRNRLHLNPQERTCRRSRPK